MKKYKKELYDSIINEKFDEELFYAISDEIIKELELKEYVKNISLQTFDQIKCDGIYSNSDNDIKIRKDINEKFTYFYYEKLFNTLFHEIEHAKENKLIDKYRNYYCKLDSEYDFTLDEKKETAQIAAIILSNKMMSEKRIIYNIYHDLFPTEHAANYYGLVNSINFLAEMLPEFKETLLNPNIYNYKLMLELLKGYRIKLLTRKLFSPVNIIINKDVKPYIKEMLLRDNELSNHERLILGLPIEKETYLKVYNDVCNQNIQSDIKEYLKKM